VGVLRALRIHNFEKGAGRRWGEENQPRERGGGGMVTFALLQALLPVGMQMGCTVNRRSEEEGEREEGGRHMVDWAPWLWRAARREDGQVNTGRQDPRGR
jgi:hypothetical protein